MFYASPADLSGPTTPTGYLNAMPILPFAEPTGHLGEGNVFTVETRGLDPSHRPCPTKFCGGQSI